VAYTPQAWPAASAFLLFQACLGLSINGIDSKISFVRPLLPPFLNEARILNLQVAGASVDLAQFRHEYEITVNVLRRKGDIKIVAVM
jgi:glycogen debranching enzyme